MVVWFAPGLPGLAALPSLHLLFSHELRVYHARCPHPWWCPAPAAPCVLLNSDLAAPVHPTLSHPRLLFPLQAKLSMDLLSSCRPQPRLFRLRPPAPKGSRSSSARAPCLQPDTLRLLTRPRCGFPSIGTQWHLDFSVLVTPCAATMPLLKPCLGPLLTLLGGPRWQEGERRIGCEREVGMGLAATVEGLV